MRYLFLPLLILLQLNVFAQEGIEGYDTNELAQRPATYPGGMRAFYQFLNENLVYPEEAIKKGIEGKVYVWIVLDENGAVIDDSVRIERGVHKLLDEESIRLLKLSPDWEPAKLIADLSPVKSSLALPISFRLPEEYKTKGKSKKNKKNKRSPR